MSFAHLTKQLAQQAIADSLRPADSAATPDTPAGTGGSIGATIIAQVQAMQKSLKDDQELVVLCTSGAETMRVLEIYAPSWSVAVLTGIGTDKIVSRLICAFELLQLVCKPMPVQAGA